MSILRILECHPELSRDRYEFRKKNITQNPPLAAACRNRPATSDGPQDLKKEQARSSDMTIVEIACVALGNYTRLGLEFPGNFVRSMDK